ncbi:MAG: response regulator [bacterium]|nr:response regulator [bacterium]
MTPSRARVLVVDDDPGVLRTVGRILQPVYDVVSASTAAEAMESAAAGDVAVALVDIQLDAEDDGYAVCRELRRLSPETDVILMTGSVSQSDEKLFRSLEQDAFYFLFKPFERRVLRALLERCLRLQRERRAKRGAGRRAVRGPRQGAELPGQPASLTPAGARELELRRLLPAVRGARRRFLHVRA